MTEKRGPPTHDLGHDASSKSRVTLGIAYRGEEAVPGLEAVHIGLSKSRFRGSVGFEGLGMLHLTCTSCGCRRLKGDLRCKAEKFGREV